MVIQVSSDTPLSSGQALRLKNPSMNWPTRDPAFQDSFFQYCYLSAALKATSALLFAILFRKLVFKPKPYKVFPAWAAIEIAIASYILRGDGPGRRVFASIRRYGGSLFGLTSTHQILVTVSSIDRFMSQPLHTLTAEPVQYTLFTRVFGGADSPQLKKKLENSWRDLLTPIERLFLNDASATAALLRAGVPQQAASLITFASSREYMKRWELSADVRIVLGHPDMVQANFQSLIRDFGACIAIPLLYGRDFLDQNPGLLDDFWRFDNDLFPLLMVGIPSWAPIQVVREAVLARSRILAALEDLYRHIDQHQQGDQAESRVDMSDVSSALFERNKVYNREGWSLAERAAGDFAVFWGQNANTQPILFWLLTYVYSTPGLLGRVRDEVAPYVKLSQTNPAEKTTMDLPALCRHCQLLGACVFETYRMANEPTSIRYVARPITIHDGKLKHELKEGMFISVPHSLINQDPSMYQDPHKFIPERFLEADPSGNLVARYGRLRPWGAGLSMCKGRTFAEKEILSVGAAILALWDVGPAYGAWELPGMMPGAGVKRPVKDIRVVISRRRV
ncbi:hypothetical protein ACJ41O_000909 [Fusarium nematophilum]